MPSSEIPFALFLTEAPANLNTNVLLNIRRTVTAAANVNKERLLFFS
jgi:hypothetical protein